jgi:hypothetical protein
MPYLLMSHRNVYDINTPVITMNVLAASEAFRSSMADDRLEYWWKVERYSYHT